MKTRIYAILIIITHVAMHDIKAQGAFQNLNFESADLSPVPAGQVGGLVPISAALPGWSGSYGGIPLTEVYHNGFSLGAASIDILGPDLGTVNPGIIDGNYTVYLQSGATPEGSGEYNTTLSQNGTLPANAESLELKAWCGTSLSPSYAGAFSVSFDGNVLSPVLLFSGQTTSGQVYNLYGLNIAPYAGQEGSLSLTAIFPNYVEFDDISFSTLSVPEPSPLVLTGIGALVFALYRRFAPKRP